MINDIVPFCLLLAITTLPSRALPGGLESIADLFSSRISLLPKFRPSTHIDLEKRTTPRGINYNSNGSAFVWLEQDNYSGKTFFDRWTFFTDADLTQGHVNYVNQSTAIAKNYTYVQYDGTVIMKADNTSNLPLGTYRDSVRITSTTQYNTGLFILDLNRAPWGCAIWPAFWTVGDNWPANGEIDILEGVHDNEHNQIAWHTEPGCLLDPNATFTGTIPNDNGVNRTNCDTNYDFNAGCDVIEWSRASYGQFFEAQGGGVLAMKWDENDISVWSFFRAAIPADVTAGTPSPSSWGAPSAMLKNTQCDITKYFAWHAIVFDITFCGQWAGNSYATTNCPGTCEQRLMNATNFDNATWSINFLKVYRKQLLAGNGTLSAAGYTTSDTPNIPKIVLPILVVASLLGSIW